MTETPRRMGPLAADHPAVRDAQPCAACSETFVVGDYVTLVTLGPGNDPDARAAARAGRAHTGVAAIAHYACITGEEDQ